MIAALPAVVARHPQVLYLIAGRTHPQVARRAGEEYRLMLERQVVDLGIGDHVEFDDRFLSVGELADLLGATDVFVTPYRSREQSASGALTFALAAGCAAVSTPYWYAEDMLRSGAGKLVPFDDPAALAAAVNDFIEQPERARRGPQRGEPHRLDSGLARSRRGDGCGPARGHHRRAAPDTHLRRRPGARRPAHRPPAHARRRLRHRPARARRRAESTERLLRRRRRAARDRRARARATHGRSRLDLGAVPRAGISPRRNGRRRHAELHELRPALARRAARRRSCRPLGLGARRRALDGLGARRSRAGAAAARNARRLLAGRAVAPHGGVHHPRTRAARPGPARRPGAIAARTRA